MHQPNIIEVPPCDPPPLEAARRELERLQTKHDAIVTEAEEAGTDGELEWSDAFKHLRRQLRWAYRRAWRLERESLQTAKAP